MKDYIDTLFTISVKKKKEKRKEEEKNNLLCMLTRGLGRKGKR